MEIVFEALFVTFAKLHCKNMSSYLAFVPTNFMKKGSPTFLNVQTSMLMVARTSYVNAQDKYLKRTSAEK